MIRVDEFLSSAYPFDEIFTIKDLGWASQQDHDREIARLKSEDGRPSSDFPCFSYVNCQFRFINPKPSPKTVVLIGCWLWSQPMFSEKKSFDEVPHSAIFDCYFGNDIVMQERYRKSREGGI